MNYQTSQIHTLTQFISFRKTRHPISSQSPSSTPMQAVQPSDNLIFFQLLLYYTVVLYYITKVQVEVGEIVVLMCVTSVLCWCSGEWCVGVSVSDGGSVSNTLLHHHFTRHRPTACCPGYVTGKIKMLRLNYLIINHQATFSVK